ncbi:hypothetical protein [Thalassospira alkalitolerans]
MPRDAVRRAADGSRRVPFLAWRLVRVAGVSFGGDVFNDAG